MKVILLGGTFDPIHHGHVSILKQALKLTEADEGWFLLANQAPLKDFEQLSFDTRAQFITWMIEDEPNLKACLIEKELSIPNYTIDTLRELVKRFPEHEFNLLIGSDQAQQFLKWKEYQSILDLVEVLVYPREGYDFENTLNFKLLDAQSFKVSSTDIRNGLKFETHPKILSEMALKAYYAVDRLKIYQSEKLQGHSLRVAKLSMELAEAHQLDGQLAYAIGIAHDLLKQKSYEELSTFLTKDELLYAKEVWHGFASSRFHGKYFKVRDFRFLEAVYQHTLGLSTNPYAQIIFIADKCEPARTNPKNPEIIQLSKQDLAAGFKVCKEEAQKYLERKQHGSIKTTN